MKEGWREGRGLNQDGGGEGEGGRGSRGEGVESVKKGGKFKKGRNFETALEHNLSITYLVACVFGVTLNWGMRV